MTFDAPEQAASEPQEFRPRELRDARVLRALAHPLRARLLELVAREGTLTATQASELTGESPANCSFHLRTLAKYGFLRQAERGRGRERPWRPAELSATWSDRAADAEAVAAGEALTEFLLERHHGAAVEWLRDRRSLSPEWQQVGTINDGLLYLTAAEAEELGRQLVALIARYVERTLDPATRPRGAWPVRVVSYSFPVRPTPKGN